MAQVQAQWTMPLSVTDMIAMIAQLPIAQSTRSIDPEYTGIHI